MTEATLSEARQARADRVRAAMNEVGVEVLLLSLGADLPWLTGYAAMPLERLTMLVFPVDDDPTLVVPGLEAPRVAADESLFSLRPWQETENAVSIVAGLVGSRKAVAISDRCWAAPLLALQRELDSASWRKASEVVGPLRAIKDLAEVAALEAAGAAADRVAAALFAGDIELVGRTERAVSEEIGRRLLAEGHSRVNFAIVASGPNSASPHHEAGTRVIGKGEPVVCDFGGSFELDGDVGYCSDITRTVVTDEPDKRFEDLYAVLEKAQAEAVRAAVIGTACEDVDRAARTPIEKAGYGEFFIHRTGHGIGIEEHEDPYLVEGNSQPLEEGHAFSVEPGIYIPGKHGARIEDIVVATEDGPHPCNKADHWLRVVSA
jgi:Xaa-Pro aminopeptidase